MAKPPVSEQVQVNFRMPVELRDEIKREAEGNSRSRNAEIIFALESYYGRHGSAMMWTVGDMIKKAQGSNQPSSLSDDLEAFADLVASKLFERLKR